MAKLCAKSQVRSDNLLGLSSEVGSGQLTALVDKKIGSKEPIARSDNTQLIRQIQPLCRSHRKTDRLQTERPFHRLLLRAKEVKHPQSNGTATAQQACHQEGDQGCGRRGRETFCCSWVRPQLKK